MRLLNLLFFITVSLAAILGIDYGQQYTKAVMLAPGVQFEILLTEEARRKDLSAISIRPAKNDEIERIYGTAALSVCTRFPQYCIAGIKPLIGKSIQDRQVHEYLTNHFGLNIIEDDSRSNAIKFDLGLTNQSFAFTVEEVLGMTFKELRRRALKYLDEDPVAKSIVDDVAVSIPPFITQEQRQAYIDALEIAGFKTILGLVDEGTAVATNYVSNRKLEQKEYDGKTKYSMIYDMGAGSTTATLFSVTPFKNLTTNLVLENLGYDESFGGQTLTQSIYNLLVEKLISSLGYDDNLVLPPRAAARLMEGAEKAKIVLSANNEYHVSIESIIDDKDFKAVITREEFEEINIDNMSRVTKPILDALKDTGISIDNLESVILTGGSTRVPFVQKHLSVLLGDDRIAKTVNADESCAVGTTVKAFKQKTQFGNNKDFIVIDKVFHNYEVAVNGEETLVFEKGTPAGVSKTVQLGELTNELSIQLYEDGRYFKGFEIEKILDKTSSLTCNDDKSYKKQLIATFTLDTNKVFSLEKLQAECVKEGKDGFLKKLLNKDEEPVEEEEETPEVNNSTDSTNSTSTSRVSRKVLRPVSISLPRPTYPTLKSMPKPMKQRIIEKLQYLDSRDDYYAHLDNIKNKLEAACYRLRNTIEDNEELISNELLVDNLREKVSDTIEWLEFESDDSELTEFEDKIRQIQLREDEIQAIKKMADTDLSLEGITKLYEDGTSIIMNIQSKMLEFGSEISEIRKKYEDEGFEFDKENDRIKMQLMSKGEDKMLGLDRSLANYRQQLTELGEIVELNEKHFNKISKRDMFDKYEGISESIVQMLADLLLLDESHRERKQLFETKLEKLISRKRQKEIKDQIKKLKEQEAKDQEAKEAESQHETESQPADEGSEQFTKETSDHEQPEDTKDSPDLEHDEL